MNFKKIVLYIIALGLFTQSILYLTAMDNAFQCAKSATISGARITSKALANLADHLATNQSPQVAHRAEEILNSPEAQKTIETMSQVFKDQFEQFSPDHPYYLLASKGFVGAVIIGTTVYLAFKSGALHTDSRILSIVKKNPEISAMALVGLLGAGLYAAQENNPEGIAASLYQSMYGWKGIFGITVATGAGIKLYRYLFSQEQSTEQKALPVPPEQTQPNDDDTQKQSTPDTGSTDDDVSSQNSAATTTSTSQSLLVQKKNIVKKLEQLLKSPLSIDKAELLETAAIFRNEKLTRLIGKFYDELSNTSNKAKAYGNAQSTLNAIKNLL